jgi:chorismate synthase
MNNRLGNIFTVTSFGESHGKAIGAVIDGMPAGVPINIDEVQIWVNQRKTGQQIYTSARTEADEVQIISGVKNGISLGTPIAIIIENKDAKSADYNALENVYRPNHADYTTEVKYGIRDHNGGGRSSIRITAAMVAAGAIAYTALQQLIPSISVLSYVQAIGKVGMDTEQLITYSKNEIFTASNRCPVPLINRQMDELIKETQLQKNTLGGKIYTQINNLPAGIGEPIFNKLQAVLAHAMLSINTVKAFEYGSGKQASEQTGQQHNDAFELKNNIVSTTTNNSGGIQGGISNGMPIYFTTAFKPISSIGLEQHTLNQKGDNIAISIAGRHDVCAVPRAIPIVNAYTAIVLLDMVLQNRISRI